MNLSKIPSTNNKFLNNFIKDVKNTKNLSANLNSLEKNITLSKIQTFVDFYKNDKTLSDYHFVKLCINFPSVIDKAPNLFQSAFENTMQNITAHPSPKNDQRIQKTAKKINESIELKNQACKICNQPTAYFTWLEVIPGLLSLSNQYLLKNTNNNSLISHIHNFIENKTLPSSQDVLAELYFVADQIGYQALKQAIIPRISQLDSSQLSAKQLALAYCAKGVIPSDIKGLRKENDTLIISSCTQQTVQYIAKIAPYVTSVRLDEESALIELTNHKVVWKKVRELELKNCADSKNLELLPRLFPHAAKCTMPADVYKKTAAQHFSSWNAVKFLHLHNLSTLANLDTKKIKHLLLLSYHSSPKDQVNNLEYDENTLFCKINANSTYLDFSVINEFVTDEIACQLIKDMPNLLSISFANCLFITDKTLQFISKNIPNLESLTLRNCIQITDHGIKPLLQNLVTVEKLDLINCISIENHPHANKVLIDIPAFNQEIDRSKFEKLIKSYSHQIQQWNHKKLLINGLLNNDLHSIHAAANLGSKPAMCLLGYFYLEGINTEIHAKKGVEWIQKAADLGHLSAMVTMARCLIKGIGIAKDEIRGCKLSEQAADLGHLGAIYSLGYCLENGIGAQKDETRAFKLYEQAAHLGHLRAMNNLGCCFQHGIGTQKDEARAFECYQKAADWGEEYALYNLGCCFQAGIGTQKDETRALACYQKAADLGDEQAKEALITLQNSLNLNNKN